tara:strand:+ start:73209 stop:73598 length:390 start_codon:yes stop_codon:yes gene_type:complete
MAFNINDDENAPYIYVTIAGSHTDSEMLEFQDAIFDCIGFSWRDQIIDYSALEEYLVTAPGIIEYIEYASGRGALMTLSSKRRIAFVAPSDLVYGMSRVFQSNADLLPGERRVFRRREDAEAWLQTQRN